MTIPSFKKFKVNSYEPGRFSIRSKSNIIKLSANESALGVSNKVLKILKKKDIKLSRYPDSKFRDLRKQISKTFNCNFNKIICGAGSDEIIQMLCQLYIKNYKDEILVPEFSFLMYRIYASIFGAKIVYSKEDNFRVSVKRILKDVSKRTKMVFIANPNNPTGTFLNFKELLVLRKKLNSKILLVIDDAYFEYMKNKDYRSGLDLFKNKSNVFILRTFSKIYGLSSLRIGWGYGHKKIIDEMYKIKPPFNVNKLAQICAIEALKDKKFVRKSVDHNILWTKKIKKILENYSISTNNLSANFLLLNFKKSKLSSNSVRKKLESRGIILREMKSYNIKNCLRLTIGNTNENKIFLKTLNEIFTNV